ncbi:glycerol-3-phosphate 1-O-acyltransferase PlsY [Candidatus Bipolaricaulota bacterium]|nr:glycerol-3-phosphate 1-O-acyltransferase PlsY [Candidatus Bipolaricaulota bacterium]
MGIAVLAVISYLTGSFPTAVIVGRWMRSIDIREHGSCNAGATNTWRVLGWRAGVSVLVVDFGKGVLATLVVPLIPMAVGGVAPQMIAMICGLAAVFGHVFPIYAGFRGGKGIATGAGMLVGIAPIPTGIALCIFLLLISVFGKVSLGSVAAAVSVPVSMGVLDAWTRLSYHPMLIGLASVLSCFVLYTHRGNLRRLVRGEERTFERLRIWRRLFRN